MLEYRAPSDVCALAYGGDTLNTAIHLARLGADVAYVTALGCDALSDSLCAAWQKEGLDTRFVLRHPHRQPGIYAIQNDASGERSFLYWRNDSAARDIYALPEITVANAAIEQADLFYCSLISLAILPTESRRRLADSAIRVRANGGKFAFDSNYRAALWKDRSSALRASMHMASLADIGLPTCSDEAQLREVEHSPQSIASEWLQAGAKEVVVKTGLDGCVIATDNRVEQVPPPCPVHVLDSSGAGDAFNAGYLKLRMAGASQRDAAEAGHAVAGWVVQRRGAIPAIDSEAPYAAIRASQAVVHGSAE